MHQGGDSDVTMMDGVSEMEEKNPEKRSCLHGKCGTVGKYFRFLFTLLLAVTMEMVGRQQRAVP